MALLEMLCSISNGLQLRGKNLYLIRKTVSTERKKEGKRKKEERLMKENNKGRKARERRKK